MRTAFRRRAGPILAHLDAIEVDRRSNTKLPERLLAAWNQQNVDWIATATPYMLATLKQSIYPPPMLILILMLTSGRNIIP